MEEETKEEIYEFFYIPNNFDFSHFKENMTNNSLQLCLAILKTNKDDFICKLITFINPINNVSYEYYVLYFILILMIFIHVLIT